MNETYKNILATINVCVDKAATGYRSAPPRLSPFQRPVLPPSFYPFHCGKKTLKNQ